MKKHDYLAYLFALLYVLVTVATLRHSAAGFASIEGGSVLWGYLSALAVDAGMALSATGLRKRWRWSLFFGLFISALASTFTQLLYAVAHAAVMPVATGAQWLGASAQWIADVRVIILPALLPVLSIVYSFAAKSGGAQESVDVAALKREMDELRAVTPLLMALPQQTRGLLYARFSGNGIKASEVAQALDISLTAARRGVGAMHKEKASSPPHPTETVTE